MPDLKVHEDLVFKRFFTDFDFEVESYEWRLWVPESQTDSLIKEAHEPKTCGHGGIGKTVAQLRQKFYWPGMVVQIREFGRKCEVCKEF